MFNIKVYSVDNVFKQTLSPKKVETDYDITITKGIGWGDFRFVHYGDGITHADRVRVYKGSKILYEGFVDGINRIIDEKGQRVIVTCTGLIAMLSYLPHSIVQYNGTVGDIIKAIFTKVNSFGYNFDLSGIQSFGETISHTTNRDSTCMEALKDALEASNGFFYLTDKPYFVPQGKTHHIFTFQNDVSSIQMLEDSRDIYNSFTYVDPVGTTGTAEDSNSRLLYGLRDEIETYRYITTEYSLNARAAVRIGRKAYPKLNTKIRINRKYNLESIKPGDTIEIRNIDIDLQNKPIESVNYTPDYVDVDVDGVISFDKTIAELKK